jgi:glycosyltransferase involved in cell wall biosynthesis
MKTPKLSIIIPTFMQGDFIESTINSIIDQDYKNYEIIVIDGGSTDQTVDILKKHDKNIAFWISEEDSGPCEAINKGLQKVTGDWVTWQNSDDIFLPGAFSKVARSISQIGSRDDIALIIGNMRLIDMNGDAIREMKYVRPTFRSVIAEGMVLTNQAAFWRNDITKEIGFFDSSYICSFDFDWFVRVLKNYKAIHINKTLGCLRIYEETISHQNMPSCIAERDVIVSKQNIFFRFKLYFLIRRILLTLKNLELKYLFKGIARRICQKN